MFTLALSLFALEPEHLLSAGRVDGASLIGWVVPEGAGPVDARAQASPCTPLIRAIWEPGVGASSHRSSASQRRWRGAEGRSRQELSLTGAWTAQIDDPAALARCVAAHPGAQQPYVSIVYVGTLTVQEAQATKGRRGAAVQREAREQTAPAAFAVSLAPAPVGEWSSADCEQITWDESPGPGAVVGQSSPHRRDEAGRGAIEARAALGLSPLASVESCLSALDPYHPDGALFLTKVRHSPVGDVSGPRLTAAP